MNEQTTDLRNKIASAIWTADKRPEYQVLDDIMQLVHEVQLSARHEELRDVALAELTPTISVLDHIKVRLKELDEQRINTRQEEV